MKNEVIYKIFEETINKTRCPQCKTSLKHRWLSQEEQEKLIFEATNPELRNGSQLSQVEVCFCPNCAWQEPILLIKSLCENIPASEEKQKYSKERDLVEKIVTALFPQKHIKVRFTKSIVGEDKSSMGRSILFEIPILEAKRTIECVCIYIKRLVKKDKTNPGVFCDILAHELAHVSPEVFKNPQHNPNQPVFPNCSCQISDTNLNPHAQEGHDKVWHDKYDEFRERIKNESLAEGSGHIALGMDYEHGKIENDKKKKQVKNEQLEKTSKVQRLFLIGLIGSLVLVSLVGLIVWFVFRKKRQ